MKKIFIVVLLNLIFINTQAQNWEWAIQENVKKFAVDSAGNIFTGYSWPNNVDSLIKRFHSNGTFSWQKHLSGDLQIKGMIADNTGNLFIAGQFTSFSIDSHHFISLGNDDIFFGKIDSAGTLLWYKTFGGPGQDKVSDLYLNEKQKIFICGNVSVGAVIGSTTFSVPEFFVARYNLIGTQESLITNEDVDAWEVAADNDGNVFVIGGITDTLDFGNGIIFPPCDPGCPAYNHFIVKYNAAGTFIWAKEFGIAYYTPYEHLDADNNGNFYLTRWGRYSGFDLSKFDSAGTFVWIHSIGGLYGDCNSLSIDNNDAIWLTGGIWSDDEIGNIDNEPFIWKFNSSNNLTATFPYTVSSDGNTIGHDYNNNIYVSGIFTDSAIFGSTTLQASEGGYFLAKIKSNTHIASVSISQTSGTNPMCSGRSATFTASPTNGGASPIYQWKINGSNKGTNSPTFTTSALTNAQVVTCVMISNLPEVSGSPATSNAIIVTVNATPATPIAGSNSPVCAGSTLNLITPNANGTYSWLGPNTFTSALQNPIQTGVTPAMAGTYSVTVKAGNCTSAAGTTLVVVNSTPTVTAPLNTSVCESEAVPSTTFTAIPAGATFLWTNSNTAIGLTAGGTGSVPSFLATNFGSSPIVGLITVIPILNGCEGIPTTYSITVNPLPVSTFTQSEDQCLSDNSFSFTNTGGTGTHSWAFEGGTPGTSNTNNPTGITFAIAGTHIITHSVTATEGCSSTTTSAITIYISPTALAITSFNSVCEGSNGTINIGAVTGGTGPYTYLFNGNGFTGITSYDSLPAGSYPVAVKDANGCTYSTSALVVNTGLIPPTPNISQDGITLTSSSQTGNQWYLNDSLIPGAIGQNYTIIENGTYTVVTTIEGCSSAVSLPVYFIFTGIEEPENPFSLSIYPNPNDGNFNITFTASEKSMYTLDLINSLGQLIYKEVLNDYTGTYTKKLNIPEYGKGVYTISLTNSKNETVKKIIVIPAN